MIFSHDLVPGVLSGEITVSIRLWKKPRATAGKRYRVGPSEIEVDAIDQVRFGAIGAADVRRSGESDREALRSRAAHAGPIDEDTSVYRVRFHVVRDRRAP
jgi:hypothetical protein